MRFMPVFAGLLLASTAAFAQPAPQGGPGTDQPPPGYQGPPPGYQGPPPDEQGAPPDEQGPPSGGPDQGQPPPVQQGRAPHGGGARFVQRFEAANVTHDGRLTLEQAQAGRLGMVAKNFGQIDADRKGYVTLQDIKTWHRAMHQARVQQQQPQGAPPPQ